MRLFKVPRRFGSNTPDFFEVACELEKGTGLRE
jgi:hypothetical protein